MKQKSSIFFKFIFLNFKTSFEAFVKNKIMVLIGFDGITSRRFCMSVLIVFYN